MISGEARKTLVEPRAKPRGPVTHAFLELTWRPNHVSRAHAKVSGRHLQRVIQ